MSYFKSFSALSLTLVMWILGTFASHAQVAQVQDWLKTGGVFRFVSQRDTGLSMTETEEKKLVSQPTNADDRSQWWLLQPLSGGGFALRNYATGLYAQVTSGTSAQYTTGALRSKLYVKVSANSSDSRNLVNISSNSGFSGRTCMHDDRFHNVVNWEASEPNSDWGIVPIQDIDPEEVKDHFDALSGRISPSHNVVVKIYNAETGVQISENGSGKLLANEASEGDFSQYWIMEQAGSNQYTFRNVQTNHYFTYVSGSGNYNEQKATATASKYVLNETDDRWERTYHISAPTALTSYYTYTTFGNAPTDREAPYVVNTTSDVAKTHWVFVQTELSPSDVEKAQQDYQVYSDISSHISNYTSAMTRYFTDSSCSELTATYKNMTDAQLTSSMQGAGLPPYLIGIALKVKNDTWSDEDEMSQHFRVARYQVYSDNLRTPSKIGLGQGFGRLSNPTGIVVKPGDVVTIFCENSAPAGSKLQLEEVVGTEAMGTTYTLNKGINIFRFSSESTLYIFYQLEDVTMTTRLSTCPDVRIHIEGGRLNGYYDETRNHNNATWAHLRQHLLKESRYINIKMPKLVLCFDNQRVQNACPTDMERVIRAWDNMVNWEDSLMGYNDEHIPGLSLVHRNVYNFFSKDVYMGGSMMAAIYGVQTLSGNIAEHMNGAAMEAEGVWGPAHECGHLRQNLICTLGSLESSNNLFCNVVLYNQGHTTQRSAYPESIVQKFVAKKPWIDLEGGEVTRMLYQFYLYFHANNVMPDFYPRVWDELRKDPMVQDKNTRIVNGGDEYLKLARTMCKVANADLSEIFEAYGFFVPYTNRSIYENSISWRISTTQQEIDETLAYMHSLPKRYGNMMFIDDRVLPVPATYEGHAPGEMKRGYGNSTQLAGDVGQYTTYLERPSLDGYHYTVTPEGVITISGNASSGLVGFKVYDQNDKLAYFSNWKQFTLPTSIASQSYKVIAAMGDGSEVELSGVPIDIDTPDPDPEPEPEPEPELVMIEYSPIPVTEATEGFYIIDACDQVELTNHHFLGIDENGSLALTNEMDSEHYDRYIWYISPGTNGKYQFVSVATDKYLKLDSRLSLDESPAELYFEFAADGTPFAALGNGNTRFDCGHDGIDLGTWNGDISGSRRIRVYEVHWPEDEMVNLYRIRNKKLGSYAYYNPNAAENLAQGTTDSDDDRQFLFKSHRDGTFSIYMPSVGKYVYAINTGNVDANVGLRALSDGETGDETHYLWNIIPNTQGYYNIIPKGGTCGWNCRGNVAGVTVIGQWSSNNSDDNRWAFEPVTVTEPDPNPEPEPEPEPEPASVFYTIQLASNANLYLSTNEFIENGRVTYCVADSQEQDPELFSLTRQEDGSFVIQSVSSKRYVGHNHEWDVTNTADTWVIANIEGNATGILKSGSSGLGVDADGGVYTNKSNIMWIIHPVGVTTYSVTYRFTHEGLDDVITEPISVTEGDNYPVVELPYGVIVDFPSGEVMHDETIVLPYTFMSGYPIAYYQDPWSVKKWFKLQVSAKNVGSVEDEEGNINIDVSSTSTPDHFAFIGTPWEFYIFDMEAYGLLAPAGDDENATIADEYESACQFVLENHDGHYVFRVKGTNGCLNNLYGNDSHLLSYWYHNSSLTDANSSFVITPYALYTIKTLAEYIREMIQGNGSMEQMEMILDEILER